MYVRLTLNRTCFLRSVLSVLTIAAAWHLGGQTVAMKSAAPLRLGAAWYPEQWPEAQWDRDLQLMQDAHMNVVRVGEFAWSTMEPREGVYELDWLERAIALAAKHHIAVVIGTPTDAPPAWLTQKYPDTLGMNADGRWREHGSRRQFSYASPRYRKLCAEVVAQLGRRFGHNPNVIGWQIGNEYTDESFDPTTRAMFQQFLREKYKTLDNLNRRWTTAYWSQTYTAWDQIPMQNTGGNPGLLLEHKHFVTATWRSFQKNQIDVLRPLISAQQFITTNIGGLGWSDNWDHYAITADLDLASWDDYVGQGHLDVAKNAMLNDFVRGWKRQNFWVMETEPGSVNWAPINNALWPGETRALAWQTIGHGADAVLYWQWRDALNGQEQYHGAIAGPDGHPLPIYNEIAQLGREMQAASAALVGTKPEAKIAILHDYDSRWAIDFQPFTKLYDQEQVLLRFYTPLEQIAERGGEAVDIVDPNAAPLDGYGLLVAPGLNVIPADLAEKLLAYVRNGGHLLLGPRSGMKDENNALNIERQPGPLVAALGGRVEQYYALDGAVGIAGTNNVADVWAESLSPLSPETAVILRYGEGDAWLTGKPAMIRREVGKGSITYLGTLPDAALMLDLMTKSVKDAGAVGAPIVEGMPSGVEVCMRTGEGRRVLVVINHENSPKTVRFNGSYKSLVSPSAMSGSGSITLPAQGVAVLLQEGSVGR
ncbi:MAG TPA: beta-galactosidase [Acidobacteriaceae bacterium]|nr:beta-galactosidase [Acidobacteriaceae bacterium]